MTVEEQIAAIRAALAAIETAIAQAEAALRMAATPDDVMGLTAVLVDLRSERARLQFQLANLEAAAVGVAPLAAAKSATTQALEMRLNAAVIDRSVVQATLAHATGVAKLAKNVRMIGDDTTLSVLARPKKPRMPTGTARTPSATSRTSKKKRR
jgi:type II secretory pathway component PulJ